MASRIVCICAFGLFLGAQAAGGQQVPLVQPGAPGQPNKVVANTVGTAVKDPTGADFAFMQGMVMHHSQAVEMVGLMKGRTTDPDVLELGKRISISQGDEIKFMQRWLAFYGKPMQDGGGAMAGMDHGSMNMEGMDHSHMDMSNDMSRNMSMDMPAMPGMLTPKQMEALRNSKGAQFDHLFLTGMIQHHTGALTMVKELFENKDSGAEPQLFDFTADVDVTQRAEIGTMQDMLAKEKK